MYANGHYGAALLCYAPIGAGAIVLDRPGLAIIGAAGVVVLATLPDVDLRLPLVTHRGITHTVWFALAVAAGAGVVGWAVAPAFDGLGIDPLIGGLFGAVVGATAIGSHLLADALTPAGIKPLWPLSDRHVTWNVTRAANPVANYLLLVIGITASVVALLAGRSM